jgi:hypothetical protein
MPKCKSRIGNRRPAVVVSLFGALALFGLAAIAIAIAVHAQQLSREYIYSGSKLLVVEQPLTSPVPCVVPAAAQPALPSDTVWVDEQLPTGAATQGTWSWDTTQKVSGAQSNTQAAATGIHEQSFSGASQTLGIGAGDKLVSYVLINPCSPPQQIMLKWRDSTGSWEHRAFWGANLINEGTLGTASRYSMGALPQSGAWVRLVVPAAAVGMEGKTADGMAFALYDGQAWFDSSGKSSIGCLPAVVPPSLPNDTIWFDDAPPAGAGLVGTWVWDAAQKVSGTQAHTDPAAVGMHYHYFQNATGTLAVSSSDNLVTYVLINPCKPPKEIMLQWQDSDGSWEHRAFWGQDLIITGTLGTASRYPMGAVPVAGAWVRLEVPAAFVGMGGRTAKGMYFALVDGEAWFDRAGKGAGTCVTPAIPPSLPNDTIWFDDAPPPGGYLWGPWVWDTAQKVSGTQAHTDPASTGHHSHHFWDTTQRLTIYPHDKLVTYVLINPCNPPQEIMLQWRDTDGSWEHRAIWGQNLIAAGTFGTASLYPMGGIPQSNAWVRLEVPASFVGLEGKTMMGMSFNLFGGEALFDRAGVARASGVVPAAATFIQTDSATQGSWKGIYGTGGYAIVNDSANYPAYAQVGVINHASHTWAGSTTDVRALQKAATTDRIAAAWYSGASFDIYVNLTDGNWHQVALYCLDWDGNNGRAQTMEVFDADTGTLLDTRSLAAFSSGRYLIWNLKGRVRIRITRTGVWNGVVSGLFFH